MQRIAALTGQDFATQSFLVLLREAAGQDDVELGRLIAQVLPEMETVGIRRGDKVAGFAAFHIDADATTLEYVAVDEAERGRGLGTALVGHVRQRHPGLPLLAETDDDAVEFYRRLGSTVTAAPTDRRWPNRRRYRCSLAPIIGG